MDAFLTAVCGYTRFRMAWPCSTKLTGQRTAQLIESHILAVFGIPSAICADNGKNLVASKEVQRLCRFYNITPVLRTPMSSISSGMVEINNKMIWEMTKMLSEQHSVSWLRIINLACHAVNQKPVKFFGQYTAQELMFGCRSQLPPQLAGEDLFQTQEEACKFQKDLDRQVSKMAANIDDARRKLNLAKGGTHASHPKGSLIYIRDTRLIAHNKMKPRFLPEPFVVLHEHPQVLIVKNWSGIVKRIHKNSVKRCYPRMLEEYENLPAQVRLKLGEPYTEAEVQAAVESGEIPPFWLNRARSRYPPGKATTRSQGPAVVDDPGPDNPTDMTGETEADQPPQAFFPAHVDDEIDLAPPEQNRMNDQTKRYVSFAPGS
jgi:hypothetical protein